MHIIWIKVNNIFMTIVYVFIGLPATVKERMDGCGFGINSC